VLHAGKGKVWLVVQLSNKHYEKVEQSKHIHVTDIKHRRIDDKIESESKRLSTLSMTEEKDYVMRFPF
jgi:hypothetical protein